MSEIPEGEGSLLPQLAWRVRLMQEWSLLSMRLPAPENAAAQPLKAKKTAKRPGKKRAKLRTARTGS